MRSYIEDMISLVLYSIKILEEANFSFIENIFQI